jgi:hypothetical protein
MQVTKSFRIKYFMKNLKQLRNLAIFFFGVLSGFFIASCESEGATNQAVNEQEAFLSAIIKNQRFDDLSISYQNNTLFLQGDFKIVKPEKDQLIIFTETADSRHIFLLDGIDEEISQDLKIEKLYYLKHGILLNERLFLGTKGNVDDRMQRDVNKLAGNNSTKQFTDAIMIAHKWYDTSDKRFKDISADELIAQAARQAYDSLGHEGSCDSGGEGATSCSLGGTCSVSCGDGYHACCVHTAIGPNDCHCDKN